MKAINIQIEASEKRIAKYEKSVAMYEARVEKKIETLRKKGFDISLDDFPVVKEPKWKYSFDCQVSERAKSLLSYNEWYSISDNAERQYENSARLADEHKVLEGLRQQAADKEAAISTRQIANKQLTDKLKELLEPYRFVWLDAMKQQHQDYYLRIHVKLSIARQMRPVIEQKLSGLYRIYGKNHRSEQIRQLEKSLDEFKKILAAPPARYTHMDGYLEYIIPKLEDEFNSHLLTLADKCKEFNLDVTELKVHNPEIVGRGFNLWMTDGKERLLDARIIFAAEDSVLVTPHTRYIVTERHTPDALTLHSANLNPDNMDHKFNYMLLARLQQDCLYYIDGNGTEENLWAKSVQGQIEKMNELYDAVPEKPEWLTRNELDKLIRDLMSEQHRRGRAELLANPDNSQAAQTERPSQTVDDDGNVIHIADIKTMWQKLYDQFPDGLTIHLPDESMAHLLDVKEAIELGEEHNLDGVTWAGLIEERDTHIVPEGTLAAAFRFPTSMYKKIEPDEEEYTIDTPETDELDWEDRTATALLHQHGDNLKGARVEVVIRDEVLPYLYIEGHPFPKVMDLLEHSHCTTEQELKQILNLLTIHEQGVPKDGKLHPCLDKLMQKPLKGYLDKELSPEMKRERDIAITCEAERMLMNARVLPLETHNLLLQYADEESARKATVDVNTYMDDFARAKRTGKTVEVSVNSNDSLNQTLLKFKLHNNSGWEGTTRKPYRSMMIDNEIWCVCSTGKLIEGYRGLEGLQKNHTYGLVTGENGKKMLVKKADPAHPENQISTDYGVMRFMRDFKGEFMPVVHTVRTADLERLSCCHKIRFNTQQTVDAENPKVSISAQVDGFRTRTRELSPEDTKLVMKHIEQASVTGNKESSQISVIAKILANVYFDEELSVAWKKEQEFRQKIADRRAAHEEVKARISGASIYGKVYDLHVRCRIDGVQQMGRPVTKEDAMNLAYLKDSARTLGKDTLNYGNFIHPDNIIDIAIRAYDKELKTERSEELSNGIKR